MPAGRFTPIITDPPLETWWTLGFSDLPATRFDALRMPNLGYLECNWSMLQAIPYADLPNLSYLGASGCRFTTFDAWRLQRLGTCILSLNDPLRAIDAHGLTMLWDLVANHCPLLASVNIAGCTLINTLELQAGALPEAMVDQILADLVTTGRGDGYCHLGGPPGTNEPPSADGQVSKAVLADRGWTVVTR